MKIYYEGASAVNGPLIMLGGVEQAAYEEVAQITLEDGTQKVGRVIKIDGDKAVLQVFEGTENISLKNIRTCFTGQPMKIGLSREMLGRMFDGAGNPIDGLGRVYAEEYRDINGAPINPVSRKYPTDCIFTGISAIDGMCTLVKGQKLPIFSAAGLSHNQLAAQMVRQASVAGGGEFAIVFAAMGLKKDQADFFRRNFEESGALFRVVMFLNHASDPIIERIVTPRCALTAAEYLAFKHNMDVLVIMTDMSSYCEALREFSSSKGEIPSRKGFPSYLYSDLASLYERAGLIKGSEGSVTQVPILTMPNQDITHPIPDLTGYITEGQIVLDRGLMQKGIYPPIAVLPSLSRLMKDAIGNNNTRADHPMLANQLFFSYSKVEQARSLAAVIGEDELSPVDRCYIQFGKLFEEEFVTQTEGENKTLDQILSAGWEILRVLPRSELDRVDDKTYEKYVGENSFGERSE